MSRAAGYPAAGVCAGTTQVKPLNRHPVIGIPGYGSQREQLVRLDNLADMHGSQVRKTQVENFRR